MSSSSGPAITRATVVSGESSYMGARWDTYTVRWWDARLGHSCGASFGNRSEAERFAARVSARLEGGE